MLHHNFDSGVDKSADLSSCQCLPMVAIVESFFHVGATNRMLWVTTSNELRSRHERVRGD